MAIFIEGTIYPSGEALFGAEKTTSLVDVIAQVKGQGEISELIVYINSPGGAVEEGFAIHDYLISLGIPIRTIALTQCASIATVIFLAGSTRISRCELIIHNPWGDISGDGAEVAEYGKILEEAEKRLEKFYSTKLNIDAQTISSLMQSETIITTEQAIALGFATTLDNQTPAMALINTTHTNQSTKKPMKKNLIQRVAQAAAVLMGATMGLDLTTADGSTLTIERDEGDPQVGDIATPDGTHVMPDGSTIIVAEGAITEIIAASESPTTEEQLEAARAQIADLQTQIIANALSDDDRQVLDAVKAMGGKSALAIVCSTYKSPQRENKTAPTMRVPEYKTQLSNIKNKK